jgi:iron complex outermembrane receptor protein
MVSATATGCAVLLLAAGAAARAADSTAPVAASDELEEVTVSGFRAAVEKAIAAKRESDSIVEVIMAEDIGKLPDSSIAEAIARLPGLAGQRVDGRQSEVSVRGMGEDFSATTLNGREQLSLNDNRGVEFDVYPSEIMSGVTVYKTPNASLLTQGIGGTIDLQTARPLKSDRSFNLSTNFEKNSFSKLNADEKDTGARGTLSYVDQFSDGKIGVALAASVMNSPNQEKRWNAWGYPDVTGHPGFNGNLVLGGAKPFVRSSVLNRKTFMGVVEFQPSDAVHITADALYIDFQDDKRLRGIEIPGAEWGGNYSIGAAQGNFVTSGVLLGRKGQVRNDFEQRKAKLSSFGVNAEFTVNEQWSVDVDGSHGKVDRDIFSLESYSGTGRSSNAASLQDNIGFAMNGGNQGALFSPTLNYADPNMIRLGGAQGWGNGNTVPNDGQDGFINIPHIESKLDALRISTDFTPAGGFFSKIQLGIAYSSQEKSKRDSGVFLTLKGYPGVLAVPAAYRVADTSLAFIGMGNMQSYDSFALWRDGYYTQTNENLTVTDRAINTWTVKEKLTTGFVQASFKLDKVSGNFGVQVVNTNQSSTGFTATNLPSGLVQALPSSGGVKYTNVLPSASAIVHVTETQQIRAGIARTLARSKLDRMNAGGGYGFDAITTRLWGGRGANPALRPQKADQLDLSYENYFSKEGYFAVAAFYKKLKDWQFVDSVVVDFSGFALPPGTTVTAASNQGLVSTWSNGGSGSLRGIELSSAIPFGGFSQSLDGLGTLLSATFLKGSISFKGTENQIPGLSKNVINATLYYAHKGFEARVSDSKRSDFLGIVPGTSFVPQPVEVKGSNIVDAQISYDFGSSAAGRLKGLKVTFQALNLTNEPFITYDAGNFSNPIADSRRIRDYQNYGSDYLLGVSYKFR